MGFTTGRAEHPLDAEDRPGKGSLAPVGAMPDEPAFAVASACPVSHCMQVNACQLLGVVNLCNWYIDKVRVKTYADDDTFVFLWLGEWHLALPLSSEVFTLRSLMATGKTLPASTN